MGFTTSIRLDVDTRDQLAEIAEQDFTGVSLGEALNRLVKEHKIHRIIQRYEELRANPDEWAVYHGEARLTDNVAGDGLRGALGECPEPNRSAER